MTTEFDVLDLNDNIYIFGDFDMNLLLGDKCVLIKPNQTNKLC